MKYLFTITLVLILIGCGDSSDSDNSAFSNEVFEYVKEGGYFKYYETDISGEPIIAYEGGIYHEYTLSLYNDNTCDYYAYNYHSAVGGSLEYFENCQYTVGDNNITLDYTISDSPRERTLVFLDWYSKDAKSLKFTVNDELYIAE